VGFIYFGLIGSSRLGAYAGYSGYTSSSAVVIFSVEVTSESSTLPISAIGLPSSIVSYLAFNSSISKVLLSTLSVAALS